MFVQHPGNRCDESLSLDPAQDVPLLRQTAKSIGGVSLLVIDPLIQAVAGDAHRANYVRRYSRLRDPEIAQRVAECESHRPRAWKTEGRTRFF